MSASHASPFQRDVWSVFGVPLDAVTLDDAEAKVRRAVETREKLSIVTPNLNWVMRALREPRAMTQMQEADLSLADGTPVVWLARQLGAPIPERVAGSDLFDRLRRKVPGLKPIRVFFFGGRAGAADDAMAKLNREDGGLIGCGALNPGYGPVEDMAAPVIFETINRARPDFIVVSLGAAKGQDWISRYRGRIDAPVIAHLGAVVDFVADTIERAPTWMQRSGLEWAWRIYAEPALWRRYLADGFRFTGLVPNRLWVTQRDFRHLTSAGTFSAEGAKAPTGFEITLKGDGVADQLAPLRLALQRAASAPGDVRVDASELGTLDTSLLGAFALLKAHLASTDRTLSFTGLSEPQHDIFARMDLMPPRPLTGTSADPHDGLTQGVPAQ
ncbi:MAG: WecB/TagA/CpsF family glycosyltransferase [Pseudomonadota bacterium]